MPSKERFVSQLHPIIILAVTTHAPMWTTPYDTYLWQAKHSVHPCSDTRHRYTEHVVSADASQSDRMNLRRVIARSCFKHASLLAVAPRLPLTTAGFVILIVKPTELSQLAASITTCDSQAYNMTQHVYPCSDIVQLCLVCMLMGWRNICLKLLTLMHLHSWELWCRCFCMLMTSFWCLRVHQDFKSSLMH